MLKTLTQLRLRSSRLTDDELPELPKLKHGLGLLNLKKCTLRQGLSGDSVHALTG